MPAASSQPQPRPLLDDVRPTAAAGADNVVAAAAAAVSIPKVAPADSFVLHAPLELMARAQLIAFVDPARHGDAIAMVDRLRVQYEAAGESVPAPAPADGPVRPQVLLDAIAAGDAYAVDALAVAWLPRMSAAEVCGALGAAVVPSLAAAGHAPIGLSLLLRASARGDAMSPVVLRGTLRALAAHPDWRVSWHETICGAGNPSTLHEALRSAPHLGQPGNNFIFPLMTQAQQPGVADRLLGPVLADQFDVREATRTLTRAAAWSMLHDDPEQAPYGWSHALTMPQAVLSLAGAGVPEREALAVAATFLLGFRVADGGQPLPERIEPMVARASARDVATAAALHDDAHVVKYTLACLHAAADDREFEGLYLSAAASLLDWWCVRR